MRESIVVGLFGATLLVAAAAGGAVTAAESTPAPALGAPPGADELQLNRLLDRLGPEASAPKDAVEVAAWIEPTPDAAEVVVTLTPTGKAKLVADPGVTVTPADPDSGGVAWRTPLPYHLVDAGAEYFAEPPTIRLSLGAPEVGPIDLDVEYAYCFVDTVCLFGEKRVTAALRPSSGGPLSR